jgi:hypothetical protein
VSGVVISNISTIFPIPVSFRCDLVLVESDYIKRDGDVNINYAF